MSYAVLFRFIYLPNYHHELMIVDEAHHIDTGIKAENETIAAHEIDKHSRQLSASTPKVYYSLSLFSRKKVQDGLSEGMAVIKGGCIRVFRCGPGVLCTVCIICIMWI